MCIRDSLFSFPTVNAEHIANRGVNINTVLYNFLGLVFALIRVHKHWWDDITPVSYTHLDVYKRQDLYSSITRRIQNEDILSIVTTYFMPYGIESDQYLSLIHI